MESLGDQTSQIEAFVLESLQKDNVIEDSLDVAQKFNLSHPDLDKILKSLLVIDYITLTVKEKKELELSQEGKRYIEQGTPEF